jgi:TonB family protein
MTLLRKNRDHDHPASSLYWLWGLPDGSPRRTLFFSIAAHAAILLALLRTPSPTFVKPSSVVAGRNGTAVTQIYWVTERDDPDKDSGEGNLSSQDASRTNQRSKLQWQRPAKKKTRKPVELAKAVEDSSAQDRGGQHQAAAAGSPFGSLTYGTLFGLEVRPAYPLMGSDPIAEPGELPAGFEGDVIVEVTIDEQGNIIAKSVIQGINPALDAKSIAALANWRFRPATKNGAPIASKHDVYFHFRTH